MTRNPHTHITRLYEFPIAPASPAPTGRAGEGASHRASLTRPNGEGWGGAPASPAPWGGLGRGPISCTRYLAGSFSYAKAFQRSRMRASGSHLPLKVHLAVMA